MSIEPNIIHLLWKNKWTSVHSHHYFSPCQCTYISYDSDEAPCSCCWQSKALGRRLFSCGWQCMGNQSSLLLPKPKPITDSVGVGLCPPQVGKRLEPQSLSLFQFLHHLLLCLVFFGTDFMLHYFVHSLISFNCDPNLMVMSVHVNDTCYLSVDRPQSVGFMRSAHYTAPTALI